MQESGDAEEEFTRLSNLHDVNFKMEVIKNLDEISAEMKPVSSSRASTTPPPPLSAHCPGDPLAGGQAQAQQGGAAGGGGDDHQDE